MKVAVVGSINMDMTVTAQRIPHKGETVMGDNLYYIPGGKGANQAVALARLGADVTMFGCVGADSSGNELLKNLEEQGVKCDYISKLEGVPTGIALITVGESDNTIVVVAGANGKVDRAYIDSVKDRLADCEMVILQNEIPADTVEYVIDFCHKNKMVIVLNPAPVRDIPEKCLEQVTYLTPNEHEAAILFGSEKSTEEVLKKYAEKLIITQGAKGVTTYTKEGEYLSVPARKANVVDTTGAGDTLNGAFAFAISEGKSMEEALKFANVAASLSTERFGAQGGMPTYEEVKKEMKK